MNPFLTPTKIIVTCSNRLAPYLEKEIRALHYVPLRVFKTGIELKGTMLDCIRLNLHLRTASQVYYLLRSFRAVNADELYRQLSLIAWEELIEPDGYFSVTSHVSNPTITNNLFANVRVKDAIVDRFRAKTGERPDSGSSLDRVVVHLYWKEDMADVFLDTSGETLSKHGYRKIPGKAPMLESLAASTILATRWDRQSPFVNPMCGSGTLAIEAALIASNRPPGLLRDNYAFMHLSAYKPSYYKTVRASMDEGMLPDLPFPIIASDRSADAVNIARINAGIAGVEHLIQFQQGDFADTDFPAEAGGVLMFNPEYGDRLGEEQALEETYARMGDFMKQAGAGYTGYIFTGNLVLSKKIGLRPAKRIEFFNGKIDCRLLEYELYTGSRDKK